MNSSPTLTQSHRETLTVAWNKASEESKEKEKGKENETGDEHGIESLSISGSPQPLQPLQPSQRNDHGGSSMSLRSSTSVQSEFDGIFFLSFLFV